MTFLIHSFSIKHAKEKMCKNKMMLLFFGCKEEDEKKIKPHTHVVFFSFLFSSSFEKKKMKKRSLVFE
jgi:hypothetical protein